MIQFDVSADTRKGLGKGKNRQLRQAGRIPAVLYGGDMEAKALAVDTRQLTKDLITLQGRPAVLNLAVDGKEKHHVLLRDVQVDPVTDTLMHVDFYKIDADAPMTFAVPIEYTGSAKGVDLGGDLNILMTTVNLEGKPLEIPDSISIDITDLGINDGLSCSDLKLPDNVRLMDSIDDVCIKVDTSKVIEEEELEEEAESASDEAPAEAETTAE